MVIPENTHTNNIVQTERVVLNNASDMLTQFSKKWGHDFEERKQE